MNKNFNNNNTGDGVTNQQPGPDQKFTLKLQDNIKFVPTISSDLKNTISLAKLVNGLFGAAFQDYEGCILIPNQMGKLTATLYFKENGGGDVVRVGTNPKGGYVNKMTRINSFNDRMKNRTLELSQKLKECLEDLLIPLPNENRKKIDWNRRSVELMDRQMGSMGTIYVQVENVDISKILRIIYGAKGNENQDWFYDLTILRPIGMGQGQFLIKIDQLDLNEVNRLCAEVGIIPSSSSIPMIRDM